MSKNLSGIYVEAHVVDRFIERFPEDAGNLTPHEIRMVIVEAWNSGAPWGATSGHGETRLCTLPSGAQVVIPAVHNPKFRNPTARTVLTLDQAIANQVMTYAGKWSHGAICGGAAQFNKPRRAHARGKRRRS